MTILLTVTHPTIPPGKIEGFRFMCAFYVKGYRPEKHCQPGLIGKLADDFKTNFRFAVSVFGPPTASA